MKQVIYLPNTCGVTGSNIVTSSKVKMIIKANPTIGISYLTKTVLCSIGAVATANNTNTLNGGVWTSSNTGIVTVTNNAAGASGLVTATGNGSAILTYTKANANGCTVTANVTISVAAVATPTFVTPPSQLCKGTPFTLNAAPSGGVWATLVGNSSVSSSGLVSALAGAGTTNITYTKTDVSTGCTGVATFAVPIFPQPAIPTINYAAGTTVNPQTGATGGAYCNNRTFTLVGSPTGGVWSSTNNAVVTVSNAGVTNTVGIGTGSVLYTVTNANGCTNSKSIIGNVVGCAFRGAMSNEQLVTSNDFTLYPNPAKTFIRLNVETLVGAGSIVLTDLYGKQIKTQTLSMGTNTIDVSRLSKGMYFVSMITSEGKTTKKLVVE